ncbi:hypothetical protein YPS_2957 [Yersinia pestis Pestoides A]|nr:hypothetical protein YPS_2957 [Yersinia pestis Pestoides A]
MFLEGEFIFILVCFICLLFKKVKCGDNQRLKQ